MLKTVLLKLSGEIFSTGTNNLDSIIIGIQNIISTYKVGIVIGGGNFFRGSQQGRSLGLNETTAHEVGMLATLMNGLILRDLLSKKNIKCCLLSAIQNQFIEIINQTKINEALKENSCIIFVGGTGNPFFSTDTNAILRALQIEASEVWKITNVDGIYNSDPKFNKTAELIKTISYDEVINKNLKVMDLTAITLAKEKNVKIRIFNFLEHNALISAYNNEMFGSIIQ